MDQSVVWAVAAMTDRSMCWPWPVAAACQPAAKVAKVAVVLAMSLAIWLGGISGGLDGMPALNIIPDSGLNDRIGGLPTGGMARVRPKGVIEVMTR